MSFGLSWVALRVPNKHLANFDLTYFHLLTEYNTLMLKVKLLIIFEEASGYVEKYTDIRSPLRHGRFNWQMKN